MKDAFSFGPHVLYPGSRVLRKNGVVVPLGSRAFDMLVAMVERSGTVLTSADLMAVAWPELTVEHSNVRVQIANLRRALGCGRGGARYIANVAGRGYCFVAPVRPIESSAPPSAVTSDAWSNVPPPLAGAIGRDACVAELAQIVAERRLVTVVGAAGAGKTTLAVLVAHALATFDGAIVFADLSAVDDPDMVADALAAAVGYTHAGGDFFTALLEVLSTGRTLIVLDNCEHVIASVAALCARLVEGSATTSFLNTSREALRIEDEFVYLLRPLASPPETGRLTATEALTWPAIRLFMDRAREGGARDPLSDVDAVTVAALCRRLDGNPHAIGLVASRVGTYGIQGVADLFESQVALHWQGRRDAIPRHQTVEALIDWSYQLLPDRDRQVLHRLSVFSGSFPLEAAVAVTSDDAIDARQVGEAIGDLVDKSLVAVSQHGYGTQVRLLETTRAFAASRLARERTTFEFARRHARYYAERLRGYTDRRRQSSADDAPLSVPELANVRAALEWASSNGHDPALAAQISAMVAPILLERGAIRECKRTCERALHGLPERYRSTPIELDLLDATAITCYSSGDYDGAMRPVVERGLAVSRHRGDSRATFHFLAGLHLASMANGEFQKALSVCAQYASAADSQGGPTEAVIAGWMQGSSWHYAGDQVAADASYSRSEQLAAAHGLRALHYFEMKERIIGRIGMSRVKWALGQADQAVRIAIDAIDAGRVHPDSLYMCVTLCFPILLGSGLSDRAEELIAELEDVAFDYKVAVRRQVIDVLKGQWLLHHGQWRAAIDHLHACLALLPPPKMSVVRTDALQSLAEAQCRSGDVVRALAAIEEAIDLARKTMGVFNLADLLRTKADVLMSFPRLDTEAVGGVLLEALDLARRQRTPGWESRIELAAARAEALGVTVNRDARQRPDGPIHNV